MSEDVSSTSAHLTKEPRSRWLAQSFQYREGKVSPESFMTTRGGSRHTLTSHPKQSPTRSYHIKTPVVSFPQQPLPTHQNSRSYFSPSPAEHTNTEHAEDTKPPSSSGQRDGCGDIGRIPRQTHSSSNDPEKASEESLNSRHNHHVRQSDILHSSAPEEDEDLVREDGAEEHSVWVLVYLALLNPLLALLFCIYTIIATIAIILSIPFCFFCSDCRPFRNQLHFFLSSPIAFQLGLIYSDNVASNRPGQQSAMLVVVNICSPIYALWISVSAWVAAGFWMFTTVMGNPDGQDGKDDGRDAVMGVRRWWEQWLEKALR